MGYLDAVVNSVFKTAEDGRKILFPWWPINRGYVIPSEAHYQRLRKQYKICIVCQFIYIVLCGWLKVPLAMLFAVVPYSLWGYIVCRHLERSGERLTINEKMANQARESSFLLLWLLLISAIAFIAAGVFILTVYWGNWQSLLVAILTIVFFGLGGIFFAKMLIVKRRQRIRNLN